MPCQNNFPLKNDDSKMIHGSFFHILGSIKNTAQTVPDLDLTYSFLHADAHIFLW